MIISAILSSLYVFLIALFQLHDTVVGSKSNYLLFTLNFYIFEFVFLFPTRYRRDKFLNKEAAQVFIHYREKL
jgi:hypothetical protein